MKRRRRTEILIKGSHDLAKHLANQIEERYPITIIEEPNHGLVMIKMRESAKNSLFYLGEVLVTEAKVQIDNRIGIGLIKGIDLEMAYWLAVIDASYQANLQETKTWKPLLLDKEKKLHEMKKIEQANLLKTKVNFETMDV